MSPQLGYRLVGRAFTRACVYAAVIAASIVLWWGMLDLLTQPRPL